MSALTTSSVARDRLPGLDGLRALAIVFVLAYHLFPGLAPGGFIGVDVFFVVSGYLITALLVAEHRARGRIALRSFWARRARRLLPALVVVVGLSSAVAALIGGDILVGIAWQLAGVLTFSSNWWSIAQGASYLDQTSPDLFRHAWSLAVEEQFYVLWPLVIILVLLLPARWLRVTVPLALAAGSAVAMVVLAGDPAIDPAPASVAYLSTLTHGFGLLLGAGVALGMEPLRERTSASRIARWSADLGALLATSGLVTLAWVLSIDGAATYRGGLVAATLLTAVVIVCLAHPAGRAGRLADAPLARWVGERSYGLYLWHWPVLMLLAAALPQIDRVGEQSWMLGLAALAISVVLAALSYRFVEQPIRRRTVQRALLGHLEWSRVRRVALGVGITAALAGLIAGSSVAVVRAPAQSQAEAFIAAGEAALAAPRPAVPVRTAPSERDAVDTRVVAVASGDQIIAIGDSVMLAAAPQLQSQFPGIAIDAVVSRQMRQATEIVRALENAGQLRPILIVGLGTNGSIDVATLHEVRGILGSERQLILVSAQAPRGWIAGVNANLEAFADDYRNVVIADWRTAIAPQLNVLARDQIHPGPAGGRIYAGAVAAALQQLAELPDPVNYDENPELQRPE